MNAHELTCYLKKYLDGLGGLVTAADLEIAREQSLRQGPPSRGPKAAWEGQVRPTCKVAPGPCWVAQARPLRSSDRNRPR